MTDVKARQMSLDEWHELLKPYGWADITVRTPLMPLGGTPPFVRYEFSVMLQGSPDGALDEWAHRSYLLDQARQAVEAVRARGFTLQEPPQIEFRGQYISQPRADPDWFAEAELRFSVVAF